VNTAFLWAIRAAFDVDLQGILDALWLARWMPPESVEAGDAGAPRELASGARAAPDTLAAEVKEQPGEEAAAPVVPGVDGASPVGSVYAGGAKAGGDEPFIPVRPVRIPAGSALPQGLEVMRGFRPLPRRLPSRTLMDLDEEATVEATAQNRMKTMPVMRPRQDRWFEAALVVEQTPSMEIWSQTVIEIERMLQFTGSFRDVRTYWLNTDPAVHLVQESGAESRIESLKDAQARRIVFFFSAGTSPGWTNGTLGKALERWAESNPVVLIHALPQRLWKTTNLGEPGILVANLTPGGANTQLRKHRAWWARRRVFEGGRCVLPVVGLDRSSVERWAGMFVARRGTTAPAFLVRTKSGSGVPMAAKDVTAMSVRDRVGQFRGNCSPEAFRLAVHLASGPFTPAVVQLVQSSLLGRAALHSQVAEVMLSGLVARVTPVGARVPPEQVVFRFEKEARSVLLESLRDDDARRLALLMQDYIGQQLGAPRDIVVGLLDQAGKERIRASEEPFAQLRKSLLDRLGAAPELKPPEPPVPAEVWPMERPLAGINTLWVTQHSTYANEIAAGMGGVTLKLGTLEGMAELGRRRYQAIVAELGSGGEPEDALDFLRRARSHGITAPAIVYAAGWAGSLDAQERVKAAAATICTGSPTELASLILDAVGRGAQAARYLELMDQIGFGVADALALIRLSPEMVVAQLARRARDVENLYRVLTVAVDAITGCGYVQLFLGGKKLTLAADHVGKDMARYSEASLEGIIGRARSGGKTLLFRATQPDPHYLAAEKSTQSELAIPVLADGERSVGVLNLESPESDGFSPRQIAWLEALVAAYPLPRFTMRVSVIDGGIDSAEGRMVTLRLEDAGLEVTRENRWLRQTLRKRADWFAGESSNCYVALVSPKTVATGAFQRSVEAALARRAAEGESIFLIPVLIEHCEVPPSLAAFQFIDMTDDIAHGTSRVVAELQMRRLLPPWRARDMEAEARLADSQAAAAMSRGREAFGRDQYDVAIASFTDAIRLAPRGRYYRERGAARWYAHQYDASIADYTAALGMDPGLEQTVRFGRGQVLVDAGRYAEAIEDLDFAVAHEQDPQMRAYPLRGRAVARAGLGQAERAEEDFRQSKLLAPDNAWLYYSMAQVSEAATPPGPRVFYDYVMSLRRRDPRLNRLNFEDALTKVKGVTGELAMSAEEIAAALDGGDEEILKRAEEAMEAGQYGAALLEAEALRESSPAGPIAAVMRFTCHRKLGNFRRVDDELDAASISKDQPGLAVERGYARLRKGDLQRAFADFSVAAERAEGMCGLALVHVRRGDLVRAENAIRAALKMAPQNADCLAAWGLLLGLTGRPANAAVAYEQSLRAKQSPLSKQEAEQVREALSRLGGGSFAV
jgi:tetratricopeptide (TPR) repeat protein/putative methionine-R-sulfoxide reductase with GAF domain